jgi:3-phosphoshikimate 1-carboxyvinyltransferase
MRAEIGVGKLKSEVEIQLPASKSISNRVLIINALLSDPAPINNLSQAADTQILDRLLKSELSIYDAGDGGTTARFLLAYCALKGKPCTITGSESLQRRPVAPLVDALNELGAGISYVNNPGCLPVKLSGSKLHGGNVTVNGEISSQFISALMLIAPLLPDGLKITLTGEILSLPYIQMTASVMKYFGVDVIVDGDQINIPSGKYSAMPFTVESDWSAASYWYEAVALSDGMEVVLPGLHQNSLQGDSIIHSYMDSLGVETLFEDSGIRIRKKSNYRLPEYFTADFTGCPDIAPAIAVVCGAQNITADLTGLKNFRLKESDRASALQRELYNFNVKTDFCGGSKFKIYADSGLRMSRYTVKTYNDHRVAMCMSLLAAKIEKVIIADPEVVSKSYPDFFKDLQNAGFDVKFTE